MLIANAALVVVVGPSLQVTTLAELVARGQAAPGRAHLCLGLEPLGQPPGDAAAGAGGRHQGPPRGLSRRGAGAQRRGRRPRRLHGDDHSVGDRADPGRQRSRRSPSPARRGSPPCPTCRRPPRPACPAIRHRPGTGCWRRRGCLPTSAPSSKPRRGEALQRARRCSPASRTTGPRHRACARRLRRLHGDRAPALGRRHPRRQYHAEGVRTKGGQTPRRQRCKRSATSTRGSGPPSRDAPHQGRQDDGAGGEDEQPAAAVDEAVGQGLQQQGREQQRCPAADHGRVPGQGPSTRGPAPRPRRGPWRSSSPTARGRPTPAAASRGGIPPGKWPLAAQAVERHQQHGAHEQHQGGPVDVQHG